MTAPARQISAPNGQHRWACRACGRSHILRARAEICCADCVTNPDQLQGGDLILPGQRPHEQVISQLEARMAELEKEAARRKEAPPSLYPCAKCKWVFGYSVSWCDQPLVKGFETNSPPNIDWMLSKGINPAATENWPTVNLCGRDKALWEPVDPPPAPPLTRWQHFWKWLLG